MAEPVRKCARCRLRVQGVRTWSDGLSYCAKCIARIEEHGGAQGVPFVEDVGGAAAEQEPIVERTAEPMAEPIVELIPEPNPEPIAEETPVTTTASSDNPATASLPPQDGDGAEPDAHAGAPVEVAPVRPPLTGPQDADPLAHVLVMERESLELQRAELVEEMRQIESQIEAIDVRASHVDALLRPGQHAAA